MEVTQLSPRFFVTGQISIGDLATLAEHGFDCIVNNRPDHEAACQPASDDLAAAAEKLGIEYMHLPVESTEITQQDIADFNEVSRILGDRILLFCHSGARSTMLWQLSNCR